MKLSFKNMTPKTAIASALFAAGLAVAGTMLNKGVPVFIPANSKADLDNEYPAARAAFNLQFAAFFQLNPKEKAKAIKNHDFMRGQYTDGTFADFEVVEPDVSGFPIVFIGIAPSATYKRSYYTDHPEEYVGKCPNGSVGGSGSYYTIETGYYGTYWPEPNTAVGYYQSTGSIQVYAGAGAKRSCTITA